MFCIHCGKEIGEKAAFCPYCGKPTSNHVSAADNYEYKEIDNEVRHDLKVEKIEVIAIVVISAIAVVLFF
ncbi:zinc-ribbon domain-containing protein [Dorea amylophila]|jgi:uncharacterized membrane protein YvbJ|uniref:zinc-ribbon domain-containing protein n=1 Tax=Dorea amylophila TaxID=2981789 RepID=UPI0022E2C1EE|nr:zinc-ribbon domain-containing protein [Dorea amylophila]